MDQVVTDQPVVEIKVEPEQVSVNHSEEKPQELTEIVVEKTNPGTGENEETMRLDLKPQRNEKGQFIEGNTVSVGNEGGRPCNYCREPVKIMQKTNLYLEYCQGKIEDNMGNKGFRIPYIEELAENLGVLTETIEDWCDREHEKERHSEFIHAIKRLKMLQRLRLQQRSMKDAPTGAIFLLKANHGFVETEKTLLAGVKGEPIDYNIHIVPKTQRQIDEDNE